MNQQIKTKAGTPIKLISLIRDMPGMVMVEFYEEDWHNSIEISDIEMTDEAVKALEKLNNTIDKASENIIIAP